MIPEDENFDPSWIIIGFLALLVVGIWVLAPNNDACKAAGGVLTQDGICVKDILK